MSAERSGKSGLANGDGRSATNDFLEDHLSRRRPPMRATHLVLAAFLVAGVGCLGTVYPIDRAGWEGEGSGADFKRDRYECAKAHPPVGTSNRYVGANARLFPDCMAVKGWSLK